MRLIAILILASFLFSCGSTDPNGKLLRIEDPKHHIKGSPDILKIDSVLSTGWYFVSDTPTAYKRQLIKTSESYDITPVPIVTAVNFDKVSLFHEKDCWALITWLDKKGTQTLNTAMQKAKGKKTCFYHEQ
jgi:hypothetical protein